MSLSGWTLLLVMLASTGSAVFILWWCYQKGQFDDVEAAKYRMLEDE